MKQGSLTHVLTHTGLSHNGLGRFKWTYDLRVFLEKGQKPIELQRKIPILAAHNPEVVGSSPASATIKTPDFNKKSGVFLTFRDKMKDLKIRRGQATGQGGPKRLIGK